jgi:hypothetical protein
VGVFTLLYRDSTKPEASGLSLDVESSFPPVFRRRRRSEERTVTLEGILVKIL